MNSKAVGTGSDLRLQEHMNQLTNRLVMIIRSTTKHLLPNIGETEQPNPLEPEDSLRPRRPYDSTQGLKRARRVG